jgi:hypothetical protein
LLDSLLDVQPVADIQLSLLFVKLLGVGTERKAEVWEVLQDWE